MANTPSSGFATTPSLVRLFLAITPLPGVDQWLRFKAQLREHAAALWFVEPSEVSVLLSGEKALLVLRRAESRRLGVAELGPQLEALWYEHATQRDWLPSTEAGLVLYVASRVAEDDDEVATTEGRLDLLGNNVLGAATALVCHGHGHEDLLVAALKHTLALALADEGGGTLRRCLDHKNAVYESTRSLLRRLPPTPRAAVRELLLSPVGRRLAGLARSSPKRFNALVEERAFIQGEVAGLGLLAD